MNTSLNTFPAPNLSPLPMCTVPTLYFIGVTTGGSSIMKIFPKWSAILGLNAELRGYDAPLHAPAEIYRHIVAHIKADPSAMGALVTTHKIDLLSAARDQFDFLDPYAVLCDEISCIAKDEGRLEGYAKDPISVGFAWRAFVPPSYWNYTNAQVLCFGAGGAAIAIGTYLAQTPDRGDRPHKLIVVDLLPARLDGLRTILGKVGGDLEVDYVVNDNPQNNDALLAVLPPGSVVINATGMGKDRPGSPITNAAVFPVDSRVWELNYRGELDFLKQARHQETEQRLHIEDGWVYFLHGWSQVIAQVFHQELTRDKFDQLRDAAAVFRA